ncbi:DUF4276 family protein [Argonema antarcticum]|uniref:DUF4276 family protein n=1 Tax=Argonema antarcticum TaxID=2942763 RepID=UPI002010FCF2|nr:DUF4276 family protein [Argonema antarcticum]MCL1471070.1 DUF4276 family protein [Argonema antarcticum A004/B2]
MNSHDASSQQSCYFFYFGLIVTGQGERDHIPKLFRSLMESGICYFEVIRKVEQLTSITSNKRKITMVGSGQTIPNKDAERIGYPARDYLKKPCSYVVLLDDLEYDRAAQAQQIFERYKDALNTILKNQKHRASVHFLVNMLEAYYFAHAEAINTVLGTSLTDYPGDVETIRHPKGDIKQIYRGFNEREDGGKILDSLDIEYVLSRPDTCASLRTLFAWCSKCLGESPTDKYQLLDGILSEITKPQLEDIP